ncbi:MAG: AAA family ATPase [Saprospiraceae bacterium]
MSKLLSAYDAYSEFSRDTYFALMFDTLASKISLDVPLKANKKNADKVLKALDFTKDEYELVFKTWRTEDTNDADASNDYPYQILFKSNQRKCIIWMTLQHDTFSVEFSYDGKNTELEQWILAANDKLRKQFGLNKKPTFNVLSGGRGGFYTEEVRTEQIKIDISLLYNDDFVEVHANVNKAIETDSSGLVLFHGKPGTGKTTYIKSLICKYPAANFIFIQNEFVNNLLSPDFISFMLKQRNAILIIEDAEKVITSRDNSGDQSVVSTILQLTDGLFSDYLNIKVICTFNTHLSKIDAALLRKGRMIAMYEFKALTLEKTNAILTETGSKIATEPLSVAEIFNRNKTDYRKVKENGIGFRRG